MNLFCTTLGPEIMGSRQPSLRKKRHPFSGNSPTQNRNAEKRNPHLLPHIFLPDKKSANGWEGKMVVSDIGPMNDAGGLQEIGGRAGKKMGGKKC